MTINIAVFGDLIQCAILYITVNKTFIDYGTIFIIKILKYLKMNGIEIIEIRALHKVKERLETELQEILSDLNQEPGKLNVKIYSRINLETDFMILIMNVSDGIPSGESQLGLRLNEALKDFGMVNDSKWHELPAAKTHLQ